MNAASNAKWVAVGQSARIISQLGNMFILARILPPSDYGLMAMAGVATNLAILLRDMGTAAAVIQKHELSHDITNAVFWLNVCMGLTIGLILLATSPLIATVFRAPELLGVLCFLSMTYPISSTSAVHQALHERKSRFRRIAMIDISCTIISLASAIIAAINGMGVYSLVIQTIVTTTLSTVLLWISSDWRPTRSVNFSSLKELFRFSSNMAGYQLVSYFFRNADSMVIGRMLGSTLLGLYSMASKIMMIPVQNITWVSARALFPVMSRLQNDIPEMGKLYLNSIKTISFLTAPIMTGLFVMRHEFIDFSLGTQWALVATLLGILMPVGFMQAIGGATGPVFMAQGKTSLLLKFGIFSTAIYVLAFISGSHWGVIGVAIGYLIACIFVTIPTIHLVQKSLGLPYFATARSIFPSVFWAALSAVFVSLIKEYFLLSNSMFIDLTLQTLIGGSIYLVAMFYLAKPYFINIMKR